NVNIPITYHGDESRKAVQSVRVDAIPGRVREELSAETRTLRCEFQLQQYSQESIEKLLIRDAKHRLSLRLILRTRIVSSASITGKLRSACQTRLGLFSST